jgi:NAD(P)-dependent dehydrogenase (short-subunit alcohol dehydrogenase family)
VTESAAPRIVVVTGAARGLGLGMIQRFAANGDRVVITDIDADEGRSAAERLRESGARATFLQLDVRDAAAHGRVVTDLVSDYGGIDVWVNNAGIARKGPAESFAQADWEDSIAVMLSGAFYGAQAAGRVMLARGSGVIINISSVNAYYPIEGRVAYSVAKAGLVSLTEALGIEWAGRGVRVVGVAPGVVMTELVAEGINSGSSTVAQYEHRTPMRRLGQIGEIAESVFFLASEQASYIVGETLRVDGGWTSYQLF